MRSPITILDGPLGSELDRRGVPTPLPRWSAGAIDAAPDVIAAIHRDYARAGASVATACTFRTTRRAVGDDWERLARRAVELARASVLPGHRVAGSIAPLEDCYRPELSPGARSRVEHRELARTLADAGVDLLLCETFPHVGEALVAVEEAARTGVP
ncbi:MAG: homocysteine S-methyltransferase family protein, partial [Myxococcota bacterium]|nr:homocysteine S-methyltransferase family protein [Myxococcota bacterium]